MSNARRKMRKRAWKVCIKHGKSIGLRKEIILDVLLYQAYKRYGLDTSGTWKERYSVGIRILDAIKRRINFFNQYSWITRKKLGGLSNFMCKTFKWHKVEVERI
ncbi:MAG: hypothetical protein IJ022_07570 [Burkholderiaceae bacterium]|nr:hypothetical protein [Burkholderiaceae bacterium]